MSKLSSPATSNRRRRLVAPGLVAAILVVAALAGGRHASALTDPRPDLVPLFPDRPSAEQKAPIYMDTYTEPGTVLYRFDALLWNQGGVLDVYRDPATGHVLQVIWPGGIPTVMPDPNAPPPAGTPGVTTEDLTAKGAAFKYVTGPSHDHFHFENAAKYSLVVPGLGTFGSAKVGFCFGDDSGTPPVSYFPYPWTGPGMGWCAVGHPGATFFREGISPQAGDLYNSQVQYQWIDVTGLRAGTYKLLGEVNPGHLLDESNYSNNTVVAPRVVAGVVARDLTVREVARGKLTLGASIVAPAIPARQSGNCYPRSGSTACLVSDVGNTKLTFRMWSTPCFGHAHLAATGPASAAVTYSPGAGAPGVDGFSYVARDARGLTSVPAYVRMGRSRASGPARACLIGGSIGMDRRARFAYLTTGRAPAGTHWALFVNTHLSAASRLANGTAVSPPLQPGKTGFWLELVKGRKPLAHRVQSREIVLDVPGIRTANG